MNQNKDKNKNKFTKFVSKIQKKKKKATHSVNQEKRPSKLDSDVGGITFWRSSLRERSESRVPTRRLGTLNWKNQI